MTSVTTLDGTSLFVKDWGAGRYRADAHDRRGHGRSDQPSAGHDMDTYADDLAELIETIDLGDAVLVGHCTGGGEVVRYLARHGTDRVAGAVLVGAVPPLMLRTRDNPGGQPAETFDRLRAAVLADRSQFYRDLAVSFYGADRSGANVSRGVLDQFWHLAVQVGLKPAHDCIRAFSETDFRADLAEITVPVLVAHGDDDQIVPIGVSGRLTARLLPHARLRVYPGAPHGLVGAYQDAFIADLLTYLKERQP